MARRHNAGILLVTLLGLDGCTVMDVDLARQQIQQGDADAGQAQVRLQQLAQAGYVDARQALVEWRARQGDQAALQQVKSWLQAAWHAHPQNDEVALRYLRWLVPATALQPAWTGEADRLVQQRQQVRSDVFPLLARLYALHPDTLPVQRIRPLFDQLKVSTPDGASSWLKAQRRLPALLDDQDPARLVQACQQVQGQPDTYLDCLSAEQAGLRYRKQPLDSWQKKVADALEQKQIGVPELVVLLDELTSSLPNGEQNSVALTLAALRPDEPEVAIRRYMLQVDVAGPEAETVAMEKQLTTLATAGDVRASVLLGRLYLQSPRRVPDVPRAMRYLEVATNDADGAYWLGQVYLSGRLGDATPERVEKGVGLLVKAARKQQKHADGSLALLYGQGLGVQSNPVYAWVFSSLARARSDSPKMQQLQASLHLDAAQQAQAARLLEQERALRPAAESIDLPMSSLPRQSVPGAEE